MTNTLKWGFLATGRIARLFAKALARSNTGTLVAVASRTLPPAEKFAQEFNVPRYYSNYEALLADPEVDIVYIATPHPIHAEWAIKAAEAKKHILCEKPIALNYAEAKAIVDAAHRHDVFLMEAFAYRCHPQTAKLVELLREKAIGEVRRIEARFSFTIPFDVTHRALNHQLAGGGILDVGCYCTSMARLIAGVATGKGFAEPLEVKGCGRIGPLSRVDEYAIASLKFPGDIMAQLATGVQLQDQHTVQILGTEGSISLPTPWIPAINGGTTSFFLLRYPSEKPETINITTPEGLFTIEADTVAKYIEERQAAPPAMSWEDTLGNMHTLDRWREAIGLVYDMEKTHK